MRNMLHSWSSNESKKKAEESTHLYFISERQVEEVLGDDGHMARHAVDVVAIVNFVDASGRA